MGLTTGKILLRESHFFFRFCSEKIFPLIEFFIFIADYDIYESISPISSPNPSRECLNPEFVEYSCLDASNVKNLLAKNVEEVSKKLSIDHNLAKSLLYLNKWNAVSYYSFTLIYTLI